MNENYTYDVAISFAEEDRNIALALALAFELAGVKKVYYYPFDYKATWGHDLKNKLTSIYRNEARYAVVLLSKKYFPKPFVQIELASIRSRMNTNDKMAYMLPILISEQNIIDALDLSELNLTNMLDLLEKGFIKWQYNPKEIANTLSDLLGKTYTDIENNKAHSLESNNAKFFARLENYTLNNATGNIVSNTINGIIIHNR